MWTAPVTGAVRLFEDRQTLEDLLSTLYKDLLAGTAAIDEYREGWEVLEVRSPQVRLNVKIYVNPESSDLYGVYLRKWAEQ